MKPHSYSSEGIVLGRRNYGEADRILSIYSRTHGKVSLLAKGARKPTSRKRGHIEVFNRINFQGILTKSLDVITEAEVIDDFSEIRKTLKKISLAYYFMEVVGKITHDGEPNPELYDLLKRVLTKLKTTKELKKLRLEFVSDLLIETGYWPENKKLLDPDTALSEVIERAIYATRVGRRLAA